METVVHPSDLAKLEKVNPAGLIPTDLFVTKDKVGVRKNKSLTGPVADTITTDDTIWLQLYANFTPENHLGNYCIRYIRTTEGGTNPVDTLLMPYALVK
jgi:hypothetical protein